MSIKVIIKIFFIEAKKDLKPLNTVSDHKKRFEQILKFNWRQKNFPNISRQITLFFHFMSALTDSSLDELPRQCRH
jgi:hypothetical protein